MSPFMGIMSYYYIVFIITTKSNTNLNTVSIAVMDFNTYAMHIFYLIQISVCTKLLKGKIHSKRANSFLGNLTTTCSTWCDEYIKR